MTATENLVHHSVVTSHLKERAAAWKPGGEGEEDYVTCGDDGKELGKLGIHSLGTVNRRVSNCYDCS